jgi:AcrR family transcriptional regulator
MGVRDERRSAAREGILAAAHRQLGEGGCASASMSTVAARAGIATGSLYRHFPSRGDLLAAVVGDALRGEQALLDRAVTEAPDPAAALTAWIETLLARTRRAPRLAHALREEASEPAVEAVRHEARGRQEHRLGELLRAGSAAGAWPAGNSGLQATAIVGACRASAGRPPHDHDAAASLAAFCLAGLRVRPH